MKRVAITGNIGSGKSTVSRIFNVMGVPVFYADVEARQLYYREDLKQKLSLIFGDVIFDNSNEIDKKQLANIIFNDATKLQIINNIIHPLVFEKYEQWLESHKNELYTLHESAILFENKLEQHYDFIITVTAPAELRIARIIQRDNIDREKVETRMIHQMSEAEKNKRADYIIVNDGSKLLIPQVLQIDKKLKER